MTGIGLKSNDSGRKDYAFSRIESAGKHLLGVINDILDMSKIEANKLELSPQNFAFRDMLQKVINVVNYKADEKKLDFIINMSPDMPEHLYGDDQRLAQIITNLLSNAVKFTSDGGQIRLSASCTKSDENTPDAQCTLEVQISDTGIGMSEEEQGRLFRSFEQADRSTSRKFGGTGLGLAISKRIVEMMNGRIWVSSKLGEGSVFAFTVVMGIVEKSPVAAAESAAAAAAADSTPAVFPGKTILLAEDMEINREIVYALLESTELTIDAAENGVRAVQMYAKDPFRYSMIFMDVRMPEMDGFEATRRIRDYENSSAMPGTGRRHIPIIAMTANVFREDIEQCLAAGMNAHVGKPLDMGEVMTVLKKHITTDTHGSLRREAQHTDS
jgi:CheY-like chemotaxis protein/two-component sensor histidine kinase